VPAFRLEAPGEMVGIVGERAHSFGPDIEQMRRLGRRISDAVPRTAAAIDEDGADTASRQLGGEDRPRRATSDNRNRDDPVRFRNQARPPGLQRRLCASPYGRAFAQRSCRPFA